MLQAPTDKEVRAANQSGELTKVLERNLFDAWAWGPDAFAVAKSARAHKF